MVAPQKYRSIFSGEEIDRAISAMKDSLSQLSIVNDFSGGTQLVASAELAKILNTKIENGLSPANIKNLLISNPNTHVLTDSEYNSFSSLSRSSSFRGSYDTPAARDVALGSEYPKYVGNELSFLADDGRGEGINELSRWDKANSAWVKVNLGGESVVSTTVATPSTVNIANYRSDRYTAMKVLISAVSNDGTQRQVHEALLTHIGTDTYISAYNEIGNTSNLFNVGSSIVGNLVYMNITTLSNTIKVSSKIIALL